MKYLTDRREIAEAINFGKYPVLTLNRENRPYAKERPDSDYATGCRVRVAWDHKDPRYAGMTTHGNLYIENGKLKISIPERRRMPKFPGPCPPMMGAALHTPVSGARLMPSRPAFSLWS